MAEIIEMPKLSDTMTVGTLVKWLKKEGDKVAARRHAVRGRDGQGDHGGRELRRGRPAQALCGRGRPDSRGRADVRDRQGGRGRASRAHRRRESAAGALRSPRQSRPRLPPLRRPPNPRPHRCRPLNLRLPTSNLQLLPPASKPLRSRKNSPPKKASRSPASRAVGRAAASSARMSSPLWANPRRRHRPRDRVPWPRSAGRLARTKRSRSPTCARRLRAACWSPRTAFRISTWRSKLTPDRWRICARA